MPMTWARACTPHELNRPLEAGNYTTSLSHPTEPASPRCHLALRVKIPTLFRITEMANGLPGNDDLGQMSSWLLFSMLGFYHLDPCSGEHVLGRPFVNSATLDIADASLQITVHNQSDDNKYIQLALWQGKELDMRRPVILHKDLLKGGTLEIWMTPEYVGSVPRCNTTLANPQ